MDVRPLSKALQKKAETELNEIPSDIQENLRIFRAWLSKQQHLKYRNDDQFLLSFLRTCKHSIERAKEKLDAYYTFRTVAPDIATNHDPLEPEMHNFLKICIICPMPIPKSDPTSPVVVITRQIDNYDPDEFTAQIWVKLHMLTFSVLFNNNDNLVISGLKFVWDLKGLHYKTALQCTPTLVSKFVHGLTKALSLRLQELHFINIPPFFEIIIRTGLRLFPKKIAQRVRIHSNNYLELHKHIPKEILPTEYGGDAGTFDDLGNEWMKIVESQREALLQENNYYSIESLRPDGPQIAENFFGVDGTFKKLEID